MEYMTKSNIVLVSSIFILVVASFSIGYSISPMGEMNMDERRENLVEEKESMKMEMLALGDYSCCLENPCSYCLEKTPGHGEGATCNCLEEVVSGVHPCGECIGEILEGHGNVFLAPYFAVAIAEKVGMQHLATLQAIISEKYGISIDEQS